MSDGSRKITSISEITGQEENVISMHEVFAFKKKGIGPTGNVVGVFEASRVRPRFMEKLRIAGIEVSNDIFNHSVEVD